MWLRTSKTALENDNDNGTFNEIYFCSEYKGALNYIIAYYPPERKENLKFVKFFSDYETGAKHFDKLAKKLGAVNIEEFVDFTGEI